MFGHGKSYGGTEIVWVIKMITKSFAQQYSKKVTMLSQQTGKKRKKAKIVADSVQFLGNKNDEVSDGFSKQNNTSDNTAGPIPF